MNINPFKWFSRGEDATKVEPEKGEVKSSPLYSLNDIARMAGGDNSYLKLEAVYSCIRDKSETLGQLPVKLFKVDRQGKRTRITSGREHRIFTQRPNDYMSMQSFVEMCVWSLERRGAFYAYKQVNDLGNVMALIPFRNQETVVPQMDLNGNVYYTYTTNDNKPKMAVPASDVFAVTSATLDGFTPISPLVYAGMLMGLAKSQEDNYKELQDKGITSQMALGTDNVFKDNNALKRLQEDWSNYRGTKGRSAVPIFENGIKPLALKLTPQEQELLQSREFSVNRICRVFRVPEHRVGISHTATPTNIFELDEAYMRDVLNPILRKIEHALNMTISSGFCIEFDRKSYYSGSPWRLVEAVDKEVKGGLATINEGRMDLGREEVSGGDVFAVDNNNVVYGTWEKLPEIQQMLYERQQQSQAKPESNQQDSEEDENE